MEYIRLFILSMVPIIELRGAIPIGIAIDLNPIYLYITCVIGSSIIALPVVLLFRQIAIDLNPIYLYITCVIGSSIIALPVVLLFRQVIDYLRHKKYFNILIRWIDKKIEGRARKLKAATMIGIIIFVGIPLPTTGTWSAAALASILKMRLKDSLLGIFIGNAIAGFIMLTVSMHIAEGTSIGTIIIVLLMIFVCGYIILNKRKNIKKDTNIGEIKRYT